MAIIDPNKVKELMASMDDQEMLERQEAADAYAGEDPKHFVSYLEDCVKESKDSSVDLLRVQDECWKAYLNQIDYSNKEDWQAKIVTNKPFQTIKGAISIVRKAFSSPYYLHIDGMHVNEMDISGVVKHALDFWMSDQNANFPVTFSDSCEMAFVVGQSFEMIPHWDDEKGLIIDLIPPWQIWRDPDAKSRDPWSGNYWIHEEWLDHWVLKQGEKEGIYENIDAVREDSVSVHERDQQEKRKQMFWKRSRYRKSVLTQEFFGVVLGSKGELLLPNATYTAAGGEIIRPPKVNPFIRMRWPGTSFSPFPHLLRFQGRGMLEGVISLWWILCNLMNLHVDNLAWNINKIREIDPSLLLDPRDAGEIYPGKILVKKAGSSSPVMVTLEEAGKTQEVLPNVAYFNQEWENGSFVNSFVMGLPGTRTNITKGEVQMKTQQSMGIFDSIGSDIEYGAVNLMWSAIETIILNWTRDTGNASIMEVFGPDHQREALAFTNMSIEDRKALLKTKANVQVRGVSAALQKTDMMEKLMYFSKMAESPIFTPYLKPYELLKSAADAMEERDARYIASPDEAAQITEALNAPKPPQENMDPKALAEAQKAGVETQLMQQESAAKAQKSKIENMQKMQEMEAKGRGMELDNAKKMVDIKNANEKHKADLEAKKNKEVK